ncbi:MAG: DUF6470 family protein [Deltaproteobacteria bacterium]
MNVLRIEQTYAKIGIETYNSKAEMNSKANRLKMQQSFAQVQIQKELPKVLIDQHDCFATSGLKNNEEILAEAAAAANQQAAEYTIRKAQDGDQMTNIRYRGNVIADIARRDSFEQHEFNIDNIPKARPRIEVQGYLKVNFNEGEVSNTVEEGYLNINFSEPRINMYLMQKPSLQIQYIGSNVDVKV